MSVIAVKTKPVNTKHSSPECQSGAGCFSHIIGKFSCVKKEVNSEKSKKFRKSA